MDSNNIVPQWLTEQTFVVQHNPNCASPYLVRLCGKGKGKIDLKPYGVGGFIKGETEDAIGFGQTLSQAAERALTNKEISNE